MTLALYTTGTYKQWVINLVHTTRDIVKRDLDNTKATKGLPFREWLDLLSMTPHKHRNPALVIWVTSRFIENLGRNFNTYREACEMSKALLAYCVATQTTVNGRFVPARAIFYPLEAIELCEAFLKYPAIINNIDRLRKRLKFYRNRLAAGKIEHAFDPLGKVDADGQFIKRIDNSGGLFGGEPTTVDYATPAVKAFNSVLDPVKAAGLVESLAALVVTFAYETSWLPKTTKGRLGAMESE